MTKISIPLKNHGTVLSLLYSGNAWFLINEYIELPETYGGVNEEIKDIADSFKLIIMIRASMLVSRNILKVQLSPMP